MPFETARTLPRRIAIVGGGISGMAAAHLLKDRHRVVLFEAEPRLGGHARTVMAGRNGDRPVDTGFIVYNEANYPNLTRLFRTLGVPVSPSNMSFGVSADHGRVEYGLRNLRSLFAQPQNAVRPGFLRLLRDISRFNARGLQAAADPEVTIRDLLADLGLGRWFRDYYLLPLSGAIWSTPTRDMLDFPARSLVAFFDNHGLMGLTGQHQWYTVAGGSVEYVRRLQDALVRGGVVLRLGASVQAVARTPDAISVKPHGGPVEAFDEIVFATHADDTLALLGDPTPAERAALGAIRYQPNRAVLHADEKVMPRRRSVWSSWTYCEPTGRADGGIGLTYWMNSLQPIPEDDPHFASLNPLGPIDERLIYDETTFRHPVYDLAAMHARARIAAFNGTGNTWFCGAWMGNGFHEDGLVSAMNVASALDSRFDAAPFAAE